MAGGGTEDDHEFGLVEAHLAALQGHVSHPVFVACIPVLHEAIAKRLEPDLSARLVHGTGPLPILGIGIRHRHSPRVPEWVIDRCAPFRCADGRPFSERRRAARARARGTERRMPVQVQHRLRRFGDDHQRAGPSASGFLACLGTAGRPLRAARRGAGDASRTTRLRLIATNLRSRRLHSRSPVAVLTFRAGNAGCRTRVSFDVAVTPRSSRGPGEFG